jgi:bacillopeptidase F
VPLTAQNVFAQADISGKIAPELAKQFSTTAASEQVNFLVKFAQQTDLAAVVAEAQSQAALQGITAGAAELAQRSAVITALQITADESQASVLRYLDGEQAHGTVSALESFWIVNGISVTATQEIMEQIATYSEVAAIVPNGQISLIDTQAAMPAVTPNGTEYGIDLIGAPSAWSMGIDGTGAVVAGNDTGVDWEHPALKTKYRGYNAATDTVNHELNFFDAVDGLLAAYDDNGHGTHTMGTMVGSEGEN